MSEIPFDPDNIKLPKDSSEDQKEQATQRINSLTEQSYQEVAQEKGLSAEEVFHSRSCEQVAENLLQKLLHEGLEGEVRSYKGWDVTNHEFILTANKTVIDPTWQQFLENPSLSLPKVLVCSFEDLEETLTKLGVPESWHHVWLNNE